MHGRYSGPADKYVEPPPGPCHRDVEESYRTIDQYLKRNGRMIVGQTIKPLPFIEDGVTSAPKIGSIYMMNDCIIVNAFRPHFNGETQTVQLAGLHAKDLERNKEIIIEVSGYVVRSYWLKRNNNYMEIADDIGYVGELVPHIPKLLMK